MFNDSNIFILKDSLILNLDRGKFFIRGDLNSLRVVFDNIVLNAFKYCHRKLILKVYLKKEDERIKVIFEDNGPGIPVNMGDGIFEAFTRYSGNSKNNRGTGIGLYISKDIVNRMKGQIYYKNLPAQKGCQFILEFQEDFKIEY
jgi:two-component system sensor histidine kinase VicK